jgi:hypothetical protein
METTRFKFISRMLASPRSRRQVLAGLIGASVLAAGNSLSFGTARAKPGNDSGRRKRGNGKRRNRDREVTLCRSGQTFRVAGPAVRAHLRLGATQGDCQFT